MADGDADACNADCAPDLFALFFTSFIIGCTVVGELKDIELCNIAADHAGERLSPGWRRALMVTSSIRRWSFLIFLCMTVPTLLMYKGADALSICFNCIAILFLCEIVSIRSAPISSAASIS